MFSEDALYEKKVQCPLCKNEYHTKKVLKKAIKPSKVEGDFYASYTGLNPIYYLVNVCLHCGFAFLEKTEPKISKIRRQRYYDEVMPRWNQRDFGMARTVGQAIVTYKLAIFCAQYIDEAARTIGGLCLHLAWLYRELQNGPEERRFLRETLEFYLDAYEMDRSIENDGKISYMIGELYRRLGEDVQAVHFFNQVIQDKQSAPRYVRMAREQWGLLREDRIAAKVAELGQVAQ